jgi:hypothetical protein
LFVLIVVGGAVLESAVGAVTLVWSEVVDDVLDHQHVAIRLDLDRDVVLLDLRAAGLGFQGREGYECARHDGERQQ